MAGIYYRFRMKGATNWRARSAKFLKDLESAVTGALIYTSSQMINIDMASAIATWKHKGDIKFESNMRLSAKSITLSLSTSDKVFNYITGGTPVRYATMVRGFRPKTTPGVLGSAAGHGGVAYIDEKKPRPGIEARGFYKLSADKRRAEFVQRVGKVYAEQLRKFGAR